MLDIAYCYAMNRNHLALFHTVAQAGGISRGAARARVSQPAVSKQIKELEHALGLPLLERLPKGSRLTEGGRLLAGYVERMAALEQEASQAVAEFLGLKRGRLAVGASTTIGAYLLPQALARFHQLHPDLELQLEIANTDAIQRQLINGSIEIGLTEGVTSTEHLTAEVFHEDELVAIAVPSHPLVKQRRVTARELCRQPFVLREEGSGTRAVVEQALARLGLSAKGVLSLASTEAVKRAVAAGLGIAIISRLAIQLELRAGTLAVIPLADLIIRRPLHLQRLRGKNQSPAAGQFLSILASQTSNKPRVAKR